MMLSYEQIGVQFVYENALFEIAPKFFTQNVVTSASNIVSTSIKTLLRWSTSIKGNGVQTY